MKKDHIVSWEVVCWPKAHGGLGVGHLKDKNKALLSRWVWRFCTERGSLWHSIISRKYGCHSNGWDINPSSNCLSSSVW